MNTPTSKSPLGIESLVFAAIGAINVALSGTMFPAMWELIRTGAISPLTGLAWAMGAICFVAAISVMLLKRSPTPKLFLTATVLLAFAALRLSPLTSLVLVCAVGSGAALLAWLFTQPWFLAKRASAKQDG